MPPRKKSKAKSNPSGNSSELARDGTGQGTLTTRRKAVRGRRGGLKDMPDMPLDVLLEIFAFMHPRDLLSLARTSKPFRAFLMRKSAQPLWKASLENVEGLPRCPSYLTEPAFINLAFFPHCHNCLRSNVQAIYFHFGARYCSSCRQTMLVDSEYCWSVFKQIAYFTGVEENPLPFVYEKMTSHGIRYHKPDFERLETRWSSLKNTDHEGKNALVQEYRDKLKLIETAAHQFELWRYYEKQKRTVELEDIRTARVEELKNRLRLEGWGEELDLMQPMSKYSFAREKFATRSEPLSERELAWQRVRNDAIKFMEGLKTKRLQNERKKVLRERFAAFAKAYEACEISPIPRTRASDVEPIPMDLAAEPEFRAILDDPDSADMSILENVEEMRPKFEAAIAQWHQNRDRELAAMVREAVGIPEDIEVLGLAVARFRCSNCGRKSMPYPDVIAHSCTRYKDTNLSVYEDAMSGFWYPHSHRTPWSIDHLKFWTDCIPVMHAIFEVVGLDPTRATAMDVTKMSLICTTADDPTLDRWPSGNRRKKEQKTPITHEVFDFWTAISHGVENTKHENLWNQISHGVGKTKHEHQWELLSPEVTKKVTEKLIKGIPQTVQKYKYGCNYCPWASKASHILRHLRKSHDISFAAVDDVTITNHCYLHTDANSEIPRVGITRLGDGTTEFRDLPSARRYDDVMVWYNTDFCYDSDGYDSDLDVLSDDDFDVQWFLP